MRRVTLKGLLGRKLRATLTGFAIEHRLLTTG